MKCNFISPGKSSRKSPGWYRAHQKPDDVKNESQAYVKPEEMQLTFLILVLCCYVQYSSPNSPDTARKQSRYIIDNRRNALFSKKPFPTLLNHYQQNPPKGPVFRFSPESSRLYPVERYHRDLSAEASISEPKFYRKFGENSLPRKAVKPYKIPEGIHPNLYKYNIGVYESPKNDSEGLAINFIQSDDALNEVTSKAVTTTEKLITWEPKLEEGVSSSVEASTDKQNDKTSFEFALPTTTTYPWELANGKTEEGNQIDGTNEKHVYETRIETVSYHQEVIFNPPKREKWIEEKQEQNYEAPEENYEEPEKNYELDEEVNVMSEGRMHAPENDNQNKFGYVVEGSNYRKYRVEERTADGFIVGEYGVVSHDDGSLRGVRYTADGNTNPKLIYETLIKFLSL